MKKQKGSTCIGLYIVATPFVIGFIGICTHRIWLAVPAFVVIGIFYFCALVLTPIALYRIGKKEAREKEEKRKREGGQK